jgi:hypothetical protein
MYTTYWLENLKGRDNFRELNVNGRIIPKRILNRKCVKTLIGFIWFRARTSDGLLEYSNELPDCIKRDDFLDEINDYSFLTKSADGLYNSD